MLALIYDLSEDYLERRAALREAHLGLARAAHDRGELLLAGAFSDPYDKALLVWAGDDEALVAGFVEADPYVSQGLVKAWQVRTWNVAIGGAATPPLV